MLGYLCLPLRLLIGWKCFKKEKKKTLQILENLKQNQKMGNPHSAGQVASTFQVKDILSEHAQGDSDYFFDQEIRT